jgi:hypothetical protein
VLYLTRGGAAMTLRQRKEAGGESSKQDGSSAAGIFVMIAIHDIENTGSSQNRPPGKKVDANKSRFEQSPGPEIDFMLLTVGVEPRNCLNDALTQVELGAKSEEPLGPAGIETTARLSVGLT